MSKLIGLWISLFLLYLPMMAQQIDYYPAQKAAVSDKDYRHAKMILEETYAKVKEDNGEFNYADYWNLAIAYKRLKQEREIVRGFLFKSKSLNPRDFSTIFLEPDFGGKDASKWKGYLTAEEHQALRREAKEIISSPEVKMTSIKEKPTAQKNDLKTLMKEISIRDQQYRKWNSSAEKQRTLDEQNIKIIDSLFQQHKQYIGKSMVGEEQAYVMWSVIQHSNLKTMERFLPVVHEAAKQGELNETLLRMLVDRVYAIKYKCQIFGTQVGIPLGDEEEIAKVKQTYRLTTNYFEKPSDF